MNCSICNNKEKFSKYKNLELDVSNDDHIPAVLSSI